MRTVLRWVFLSLPTLKTVIKYLGIVLKIILIKYFPLSLKRFIKDKRINNFTDEIYSTKFEKL